MLALCLVWSLQQILLKATADAIAPTLQIALRSGTAAVLVWLFMRWRGMRVQWSDGNWRAGVLVGVLFAFEYLLVGESLNHTSAAHVVVFLYSAPVFAALGLHWKLPSARLAAPQWLGIVLAFAGIALAFLGGGQAAQGAAAASLLGDLMALGAANLLSGLFQGMPVGAGYSATSANEVAGAQSRAAGLVACAVVGLAVWLLLPWIERTPEPLLAAIVIHAVGHMLNPASLRPCFAWRRDRAIALLAFGAVLLLGVLDGLLLAIAASLLMLLRSLSRPRVSWLGRLADTRDFVDADRHPDAQVPRGLLIARPEAPLFFGNADPVFSAILERLRAQPSPGGVVLSLEESADLDATSVEALCDFAAQLRQLGVPLALARVKDPVRDLLERVGSHALAPHCYAAWSVDDAVRQLLARS